MLTFIPGSMSTPGFVVRGKGNKESTNSASHGAGRLMSRSPRCRKRPAVARLQDNQHLSKHFLP